MERIPREKKTTEKIKILRYLGVVRVISADISGYNSNVILKLPSGNQVSVRKGGTFSDWTYIDVDKEKRFTTFKKGNVLVIVRIIG